MHAERSEAVSEGGSAVVGDRWWQRAHNRGWYHHKILLANAEYQYDASGDVTQDSENQYLYDADGHVCATYDMLTHIMTGYLYDAEGNRVAKGPITTFSCDTTSNGFGATGSDNLYILGPGGEQLTEMTWSGGVALFAATNVRAAGELIASYTGSQVALNFQLRDWLGTLRVETDSGGTMQENCESLPYGNGETCATPPYLFTGKERDAESGNDYFGARYFASNMGRFITPDWSAKAEPVPYAKMGDPQSLNLYSYVLNNPFGTVDQDGHAPPGQTQSNCDLLAVFSCYPYYIAAQEPAAPPDSGLFGGGGKKPNPVANIDKPYQIYGFSTPLTGCPLADPTCQLLYERFREHVRYLGYFYRAAGEFLTGKGNYADWLSNVKTCVGGVGLPAAADWVNPLSETAHGAVTDAIPAAASAAERGYFNRALTHAISRELTTPLKSSIYRGLMKASKFASEAGDAVPLAAGDSALLLGVIAEAKGCN